MIQANKEVHLLEKISMISKHRNEIPDEWNTFPLRSLCLKTAMTDPKKNPELSFEYVDVSAVSKGLWKITMTTQHTGTTAPSRARKLVRTGDVIFATVRPTLKRVAIVPDYLNGQIVSTAFCVLRSKPTRADPLFIYYSLLTDEFINQIGNLQQGASYPAVSDSDVMEQQLCVPPLPEQRAIATVLSKIQAAVEVQDKIVVTLKELKAATMAKLFREGLRGEPLKKTEIGEIPESWEVVQLGDLVQCKNGINFSSFQKGQGVLTVDVLNMYSDNLHISMKSLYRVDITLKDEYLLKPGDILFVRSSLKQEGVGWSALFSVYTEPVTFCGFLIRARLTTDRVYPEFLVSYLRLPLIRRVLVSKSDKVAITNISQGNLKLLPIVVPAIAEQQKIAHIVSEMDKRIEIAKSRRNRCQALFNSMLHLLMTGQVRVNHLKLGEE